MLKFRIVAAAAICGAYCLAVAQNPMPEQAIFNSDPNHIWNRTYMCLFSRQSATGLAYGLDLLDPPLWAETRYLLTGASYRRALACLDEFLRTHAERQMQDPIKRAVLQRDLWAIFDWAAERDDLPHQRRDLEVRLTKVIRLLALKQDQIDRLPKTYEEAVATQQFPRAYDPRHPQKPFLPPDLFRLDGPWVCISAYGDEPTAITHFSGRSRFLIFMQLPGGRDITLAYIRRLRSWSAPLFINDSEGRPDRLNLSLPQFPQGTQVGLVRQAFVINTEGKLVPTTLTESVQLRVYHTVTTGSPYLHYINGPSSNDQDFFELRMQRAKLFANHDGGLAGVRPGEEDYPTFSTYGDDPLEDTHSLDEKSVVLDRCLSCHSDSGIHSVQSRTQWVQSSQRTGEQRSDNIQKDPIVWETNVTIARKERQPEFKLLQKLWHISSQ